MLLQISLRNLYKRFIFWEIMTKAIILCAGEGTRLLPLTKDIPKPLVPINNIPLLEYNIKLCKFHGITDILINTSYLPEKIKEYFGNGESLGVKITYSYESKLLGTSGALNNFRKFLKGSPFTIIYGDNLTDINLRKMLKYHQNKGGIATLALRKKPQEYKTQSLILADKSLRLIEFIEKPSNDIILRKSSEYKLINSGIYFFNPAILDYIPEGFSDFAYDIFPNIINKKEKVYGFLMDDYYFREVGKIEKYNIAKDEIESGKIKLNYMNNE